MNRESKPHRESLYETAVVCNDLNERKRERQYIPCSKRETERKVLSMKKIYIYIYIENL